MIIVVVLPLANFLVEEVDVVRNSVLIDELAELLVIKSKGAFNLAIEKRGPRVDADMQDIL